MSGVHPEPVGDANLDFRKVFIVALLAGISAIGYGQASNSALASVLSPLFVMLVYLAIGIRYAERGEKVEQFADSIYYLGFLFTLVALTASLLAYKSSRVEFNLLVANFALALVTTIFGLAARIVIVNFRITHADRDTLQDILDHQTARLCRTASRISRELESVNRATGEHHKSLMEENAHRIESAYRAIESLSEQAANSIHSIAVSANAELAQTLGELRGRIESSHFPEDILAEKLTLPVARFAEKMDKTGELLGELQDRQKHMQADMQSAAESIQNFEKRINGLNNALRGFTGQLEVEQDSREKFVELAQAMNQITASSTDLSRELRKQSENSQTILNTLSVIVDQLNRVPTEVDVTTSAIRQSTRTLVKSSTVLASQSGTVREHLEGLSQILGALHQRFNGFNTLMDEIEKTSNSLTLLVKTLNSSPGRLSELERAAQEKIKKRIHQ